MPQFTKNIIIAIVSTDEAKTEGYQTQSKAGIMAYSKKYSSTNLVIEYDPRIGFTEEQKRIMRVENEEDFNTTRFSIVAHGNGIEHVIYSLGNTLSVTPKKLAKDLKNATDIKPTGDNPLNISLVSCKAVPFALDLQKELQHATVKVRTKKVSYHSSSVRMQKKTESQDGALVHKAPGSKEIIYTDKKGQQQVMAYDYNEKRLYNQIYLQKILIDEDTEALKKYFHFFFVKYGKKAEMKAAGTLLQMALDNKKIRSLAPILNSIDVQLISKAQHKQLMKTMQQSGAELLQEALKHDYSEVINLIDKANPEIEFKDTSKIPKQILKARKARHELHQEILDLKLPSLETQQLAKTLNDEYQTKERQAFYQMYHGKSLAEFAILTKNNALLKQMMASPAFTYETQSIEDQNNIINLLFLAMNEESLESFEIILGDRNIDLLTKYPIPFYSTPEGNELTLLDYALHHQNPVSQTILLKTLVPELNKIIADRMADKDTKTPTNRIPAYRIKAYIKAQIEKNPDEFIEKLATNLKKLAVEVIENIKEEHIKNLQKLKLYIIHHDFKTQKSGYEIDISPGKSKTVPKTVHDHWEQLQSLTQINEEEIYSEIITTAQKAKDNPPKLSMFVARRSDDTINYIEHICEESFDYFEEKPKLTESSESQRGGPSQR